VKKLGATYKIYRRSKPRANITDLELTVVFFLVFFVFLFWFLFHLWLVKIFIRLAWHTNYCTVTLHNQVNFANSAHCGTPRQTQFSTQYHNIYFQRISGKETII